MKQNRRPNLVPSCAAVAACTLLIGGLARGEPPAAKSLGSLPVWDDGFAEMSYYDAVTSVYGTPRQYTRVHIIVREWFDHDAGVKTDHPDARHAIKVFKFNIAEQIPTENYQYRYMRTLFADRRSLRPQKFVATSQEWCGTSFKYLRWRDQNCQYRSFTYFEGEADHQWELPAEVMPFETVYLAVRELAGGGVRTLPAVLPPMRSNRQIAPDTAPLRLEAADQTTQLTVPAGTVDVRPVRGEYAGRTLEFWVETAPPYRLIQYDFGNESGKLHFAERRAYWDRKWPSGAYKQGHAP